MFTKFSLNQDSGAPRASKRRKSTRPRACNACRQRKIKCDADQRAGQTCSNCQTGNVVCVFTEGSTKVTEPDLQHIESSTRYTDGYVESLEQRLAVMEAAVQQLQVNSSQVDTPLSSNTSLVNPQHGTHAGLSLCPPTDFPSPEEVIKQNEADILPDLVDVFEKLDLESSPLHFYGKTSGPSFIHQARAIRARFLEDKEVSLSQFSESSRRNERAERKAIWTVPPWEAQLQDTVACRYQFPEPELLTSLIDLYFVCRNHFIPLLHRPSFNSSVAQGLHLHDHGFGSVVLLVCAIASRHSDDPRVLLEKDASGRQSAGWKYFIQVPPLETSVFSWPTLYDLQRCALAAIYTQGCSIPRGFWTMSGIGMKIAQDLALHRRQPPKRNMRRTEYELYKRAFWVLVWLDQNSSLIMGRTVTIQDDDIATELPLLCDDEYWFTDTGEDLLEQPSEQPSKIVFFVEYLRLMKIHVSAMKFIYSANTDPGQIDNIIVDLDSELNKWHSAIPSHLTWDPHREDIAFFQQSAALNCAYNSTLITVHRSFMLDDKQRPTHPSSAQVFANLAVCTNAARTIVHIIERQHNRGLLANATTSAMYDLLVSTVVLLLSLWASRMSARKASNVESAIIPDINTALDILKTLSARSLSAARALDLLRDLAMANRLRIPCMAPSNKRAHEDDPDEDTVREYENAMPPDDTASGSNDFYWDFSMLPDGGTTWDTGLGVWPLEFADMQSWTNILDPASIPDEVWNAWGGGDGGDPPTN